MIIEQGLIAEPGLRLNFPILHKTSSWMTETVAYEDVVAFCRGAEI